MDHCALGYSLVRTTTQSGTWIDHKRGQLGTIRVPGAALSSVITILRADDFVALSLQPSQVLASQ
jgi:hypothetical protein